MASTNANIAPRAFAAALMAAAIALVTALSTSSVGWNMPAIANNILTTNNNAFNWRLLLVNKPRPSPRGRHQQEEMDRKDLHHNNNVYRNDNSLILQTTPLSWLDEIWSKAKKHLTQSQTSHHHYPTGPVQSDSVVHEKKVTTGTVVRLACRPYQKSGGSKPSSRQYTTKKQSQLQVVVTKGGIQNDYNHYRTVALHSTLDRAVSILTDDVIRSLQSVAAGGSSTAMSFYGAVREGDLGENILVNGVNFRFFEVGKRYKFRRRKQPMQPKQEEGGRGELNSVGEKVDTALEINSGRGLSSMSELIMNNDDGGDEDDGVVVEITEPIVPCANLCKLPYINDDRLEPKERIERCKEFLDRLGKVDGFRGWYAKVVSGAGVEVGGEGVIHVGDLVTKLG